MKVIWLLLLVLLLGQLLITESGPSRKRPPPPKKKAAKKPPPPPPKKDGTRNIRSPPPPSPAPPPPPPAPIPPPSPVKEDESLDIWIVAGGSNAWGDNGPWDGDASWEDPPCTIEKKSMLMWGVKEQRWMPAQKNVHSVSIDGADPSNTTGPDIPFMNALLDMGLTKRVGVIPCSMPGTVLFWNWMPWRNYMFQSLLNQTNRAMAAAGSKAVLRGMIMMLGEGDAMKVYNTRNLYNEDGTKWAFKFGGLMQELLSDFRVELAKWNPVLPVIISLQAVKERDKVFPYIETVRNQTIALQMPNLIKADMEGCRIFLADYSGYDGFLEIYGWEVGWQGVHLSRQGQCCMAQRMAVAYRDSLSKLTNQKQLQLA